MTVRPSRPRISFIINSLAGGGAERVMTTVLTYSAARRDAFDIELVLLDDEPDAYAPPDWLKVTRLGGRGGLFESIRLLRAHLARRGPDITLSFLTRANIANAIVMAARRKPFLISERIHTSAHLGNGVGARFAKFLVARYYRRADRVICVSNGVGQHLVERFGVPAVKVVTIYNPFDLDRIARLAVEPLAETLDKPFCLAMGRLVEAKNFGFLIRAFRESGIPQRLVIAGEGPLRAELEALVANLGLVGRVTLTGFTANPYAMMRQADFYILSSNAEGFPNGLVEAMAVGLPVLATDCPSGPAEILEGHGAPACVTEGRHGLLVPCGDVGAMSAGLRAISGADERLRLAVLAKTRAQDFAAGSTTDIYWNVISRTLAARS